ncbi:MAG: hypothetical protein ACI9LX_004712 [Paraglaciecola sp.]|jgi:hypothetical protein
MQLLLILTPIRCICLYILECLFFDVLTLMPLTHCKIISLFQKQSIQNEKHLYYFGINLLFSLKTTHKRNSIQFTPNIFYYG